MTVIGKHALFIKLEKTNFGYWKFSRIIFCSLPPPLLPPINPLLNNAFALLGIKLHNKSQTNKFKIQKFLTFFSSGLQKRPKYSRRWMGQISYPVRQRIRNLFHFHIQSHSVAVCPSKYLFSLRRKERGEKNNGCATSTFSCTAILGVVANRDVDRGRWGRRARNKIKLFDFFFLYPEPESDTEGIQ